MGTGGRQAEMSRPGNGCALGPDKSMAKKNQSSDPGKRAGRGCKCESICFCAKPCITASFNQGTNPVKIRDVEKGVGR